ncbi:MAG: glycosyltransferase family 9 protein [Candidatus Kapabacteria bacterium]|nr:glycosyltransferase family 9 protein [Candidatus Kapabacteria bacterium]
MNTKQAQNILQNAKRIGIVRTDKLGDMVLTLPLAHALHERFPNASIEMIAQQYVAPLLNNSPVLSAVHYTNQQPLQDVLRTHSFDALFFPRMRDNECYAAWRANVPLRVGSGYRWYSWMLNYRIKQHRKTAERNEAEYNVAMLGAILGETITPQLVAPIVSEQQKQNVRQILQQHGTTKDTPLLVFHPGSGGSSHDWPANRFGEAAQQIAQLYSNASILITGIHSESTLCNTVAEQCPQAINLCGKLDLPAMIALLSQSQLLVANSTGVLHIAASFGTAVVGLYPNTPAISARRWGPYSTNSRTVSPPMGDDMNTISADSVVRSIQELLVANA